MTDDGVGQGAASLVTSASLLGRVRASEPAAWARLVDLYGPLVYQWCRRAKLQPADAADIGQEVFAAVARALTRFRGDREGDSFRGWLFTITRNKIRDFTGSVRSVGIGGSAALRALGQMPTPLPELDDPGDDDRGYLVRRAVELVRKDFEPATWEAFWRSVVDGRAADEVAAELGMTRNAVYLAKARVRKRLSDEFAELVEFEEPAGDPGARSDLGGDR